MNARVAELAREHFYILLGAAAFLLSFGSGLVLDEPLVGGPMILGAGAVGYVGVRSRDARETDRGDLIKQLELAESSRRSLSEQNRLTQSRVAEALQSLLGSFGQWSNLNSEARVSLYLLETPTQWRRLVRYSENISYMQSGRKLIASGHGVLHQAHVLGEFFIDNLADPQLDRDAYLNEQRSLGLAMGAARALTMPSRSYASFAFDRFGSRDRGLVLVFESTDANGLEIQSLRSLLHIEARRLTSDLALALLEAEHADNTA